MKKKIHVAIKPPLKAWLSALGLLVLMSAVAQDITTGLKLHYSFDAITGTVVDDNSGNSNNGSLQGGATVVDALYGKGVQCMAKADYISAPANLNSGLYSFTFATWVKFTSLKNATRFFDWGTGADATNNFLAFIPSYNSDDGFMVLRYRATSGSAVNVTSTVKCPVGTWAHVALTFNWNASNNTATAIIYLNGEVVGTSTGLTFNPHTSLGSTANNYFGLSRWAQDTNGFNGIFDDVRVYNRALSATDVMALTGLTNLNLQHQLLNLDNLNGITNNINLPTQGPDYPEVSISWSSSFPGVISATGEVTRPAYFNADITLTATLSLGAHSKTKTFNATVLAQEGTSYANDLLVRYDFSNLNDKTVTDVAEKQFTGTLLNNATIRTIGTSQTGIYNVLDLGNGTGYFDMGTEVGKVMCQLTDFTIGAYYRIENEYTGLTSNGNYLWTFSNSNSQSFSKNGYVSASLKDLSAVTTPGFNTKATGYQAITFGNEALKGNWHHVAYTQKGNTGTLYVDGVAVQWGTITNTPKSSLIKDGLMGTPYNWIGRSCYATDVLLRRTMVYDFRVYSRALTSAEINQTLLRVPETIETLEAATKAFTATSKTAETAPIEKTFNNAADALNVVDANNSVTSVELSSIKKVVFSSSQMSLVKTDGVTIPFETANVAKMVFGNTTTNVFTPGQSQKLDVYPNPATHTIWVKGLQPNSNVVLVYSVTGQLLLQKQISESNGTINISSLPVGLYIVKSGQQVAKFTKK